MYKEEVKTFMAVSSLCKGRLHPDRQDELQTQILLSSFPPFSQRQYHPTQ